MVRLSAAARSSSPSEGRSPSSRRPAIISVRSPSAAIASTSSRTPVRFSSVSGRMPSAVRIEFDRSRGRVKVTGEGYQPAAHIEGEAASAATQVALTARAASLGRVILHGQDWRADGDPMEAAIDVLTRRLTGTTPADVQPARRFAFDPNRRRESVIVGNTLFVKGAPESVLPLCGESAGTVSAEVEAMASRGLRVIAVAIRKLPGPSSGSCDPSKMSSGDPISPTSRAIAAAVEG